ncbi:alpha/beta-hydrolase [Tothia fuscella]|uniref:Alpha/beta-hydrolase n=1 Tax=Tothia fuscella TaxID=1048955 RepID=A0A9P4U2R2_9PEZI|nr:alpha/beta-hydrolase [Tothia fuscella]
MGILTYQPFKALYTLLAVALELTRLPLWLMIYTIRAARPHPAWTQAQAVRMRVVKAFLAHSSAVEVKTKLTLAPGKEKERFVITEPAPASVYKGPTIDSNIKPATIGATWTLKAFNPATDNADNVDVVLHFHGGAYVIGNGRDEDVGFLAKTLLKHAQVTHVFTPQYRLSSNPGGRFPAQLQDAITSYYHLIHTLKIPAHRITISGDSAGGNLAFALLRYLATHGDEVNLPQPGCAWLWSPWVDIEAASDPKNIGESPQYSTDYLGPGFGYWGATTFCPDGSGLKRSSAWLSPLNNPFATTTPIFIQTGRAEVLYDDDIKIADQFREIKGNKVELLVTDNAPHDIILVGALIGFQKDAGSIAKSAGEFLRAERAKL